MKYQITEEQLKEFGYVLDDLVDVIVGGNYKVFNITLRLRELIEQVEMQDVES